VDAVGVTGQYVVYRLMVSVVTEPYGQLVTVDAQLEIVYVFVVYIVEIVYSAVGEDAGAVSVALEVAEVDFQYPVGEDEYGLSEEYGLPEYGIPEGDVEDK